MSEEPPPPDLIDTDDVPLDEFVSTNAIEPEVLAEALGTPTPLFAEARPLELSAPPAPGEPAGESAILEGTVRPALPASHAVESPSGVARLLGAHRDHGRPIYRRQGVIAVVALVALIAVVVVSFPRTNSTLESGLEIQADVPAPASGAVANNAGDGVDPAGSDGFFRQSKADQGSENSTAPASTEALSELANTEEPNTEGETPATDPVDPATGGSDQAIVPPPPYIEVETSVVVGPLAPGCCDPTTPETTVASGPSEAPTTQKPANAGETTTTTRATVPTSQATTPTTATPSPTTATTERVTTTKLSATTEATTSTVATTDTTEAPSTTEPASSSTTEDTSSTSAPDTTETTTATSTPTTETTEEPETTVPGEDLGTTPTAVGCTDDTSPETTPTATVPGQPCQPAGDRDGPQ